MSTSYVFARQIFDMGAWGQAIQRFMQDSGFEFSDMGEVLGVDEKTVKAWVSGDYIGTSAPYPKMKNFLKVCNELDIPADEFFSWRYYDSDGVDVTDVLPE